MASMCGQDLGARKRILKITKNKFFLPYRLKDVNSSLLAWIRDIIHLHRVPPRISDVYRVSNVAKWPTEDGPMEMARVYQCLINQLYNACLH